LKTIPIRPIAHRKIPLLYPYSHLFYFTAQVTGSSLRSRSRDVGAEHDLEQRGLQRGVGGPVTDIALQVGGGQPALASIEEILSQFSLQTQTHL